MSYGIRFDHGPDLVEGGNPPWIRLVNGWHGWWLERYEVDAHEGLGEASFTKNREDAIHFDTVEAARACWYQQSKSRPEAPAIDGQLRENRPLAPYSIIIDELTV